MGCDTCKGKKSKGKKSKDKKSKDKKEVKMFGSGKTTIFLLKLLIKTVSLGVAE